MEPNNVSNSSRTAALGPTPEELEAQACLPPPEELESRAPEAESSAAPSSPPAVKALVDKHPSSGPATLPASSAPQATATKSSEPPLLTAPSSEGTFTRPSGLALGVGVNAALGTWGGEVSLGVLMDIDSSRARLFLSTGQGAALAPLGSAGVSAQATVVKDVQKFWGRGAELGLNPPVASGALGFTEPTAEGPRELNSATVAVGASVGADAHTFVTNTRELGSYDVGKALQAAARTGLLRRGP